MVLAAVSQKGQALVHAASELKDDKEVVLAAVQRDGTALLHATDQLKEDEEVVKRAVEQEGSALRCTPQFDYERTPISPYSLKGQRPPKAIVL